MEENRQKGFTLLEVLIALAILSIGLLAINAMTIMVIQSNYKSRNLTTAVNLAQNKLDDLKISAYASIIAGSETNLNTEGVSGSGIFNRSVTVTTNATPSYKTVEVKISWIDPGSREIAMQTIISE
jgi:type IV pilus modification protein PilV